MNTNSTEKRNYRCLERWLTNKERGKSIATYFCEHGMYTIGIYGCGTMGRHLIAEMDNSGFPIAWIMDRSVGEDTISHPIIRPEKMKSASKVDLIIITALGAVEEIEAVLRQHFSAKILALDEIVDTLYTKGDQNK